MRWLKVQDAAREWAGGMSAKTMYRAIRDGHLRAARIGSGRNMLVCEQQVDEWLMACTNKKKETAPNGASQAALGRRLGSKTLAVEASSDEFTTNGHSTNRETAIPTGPRDRPADTSG